MASHPRKSFSTPSRSIREGQQPHDGAGARAGYFVIADISGYTQYLAGNELAHAQGVLAELTSLLIHELSAPFRFVELGGDAVFVFAPDVAVEDAERLIDIVEARTQCSGFCRNR